MTDERREWINTQISIIGNSISMQETNRKGGVNVDMIVIQIRGMVEAVYMMGVLDAMTNDLKKMQERAK